MLSMTGRRAPRARSAFEVTRRSGRALHRPDRVSNRREALRVLAQLANAIHDGAARDPERARRLFELQVVDVREPRDISQMRWKRLEEAMRFAPRREIVLRMARLEIVDVGHRQRARSAIAKLVQAIVRG